MSAASTTSPQEIPRRIGLIAGQGNFPILLAQAARSEGVEVVTFGIRKLASEEIARHSVALHWLKLTEFSRFVKLAKENQINHVIMAGRVPHNVLLQQISFDFRTLKILGTLPNKKADTLLKAVTDELRKEGIEVMDSTIFLKSCMPEPGRLTPSVPLTEEIQKDLTFGYPLAKEIGRLDIGQSIAVKNQIVIAVEALEGTDRMIQRAGKLAPGCVFIKVSKPRQDMRFDVPVVGLTTIHHLIRAQASALCVTSGQSLFFDREEAIPLAEKHDICIIARPEKGEG